MRTVYCVEAGFILTTGEDKVALMFIQRKLSKLHRLADHGDVTPAAERNITTLRWTVKYLTL